MTPILTTQKRQKIFKSTTFLRSTEDLSKGNWISRVTNFSQEKRDKWTVSFLSEQRRPRWLQQKHVRNQLKCWWITTGPAELAYRFRVTRATDMRRALPTGFLQMLRRKTGQGWRQEQVLSVVQTYMRWFSAMLSAPLDSLTGSKSLVAEAKVRATNPLNPMVFMGVVEAKSCKKRRFSLSIP